MTIWKFPLELTNKQEVQMPVGANVISVDNQHGQICMWALVNDEAEKETRTFEVVGTGHYMRDIDRDFVGTVQQGPFVWHVFEVTSALLPAA